MLSPLADSLPAGPPRSSTPPLATGVRAPVRACARRRRRRRDGRSGRQRLRLANATTRGVEVDPARAREPGLHPGMRHVAADRLPAARVALAGQESLDEPGRDSFDAKHHHHRRGEVLAVARPRVHEAVDDTTAAAVDVRDVRAVGEVARVAQVRLDLTRDVVRGRRRRGADDLGEERARLRPHRTRLDRRVRGQQVRRIVGPGRPEAVRGQGSRIGGVGQVRQERLQPIAAAARGHDPTERGVASALDQGHPGRPVEPGGDPGRHDDARGGQAADLVVGAHVRDGVEGCVLRAGQQPVRARRC